MRIWLTRTLNGAVPDGEDAMRVFKRFPPGTSFECDVIASQHRSAKWNRRYRALCKLIASHTDRIDCGDGLVLPVHDQEGAHVALKYLTGLYDSYAIGPHGVVRLLKSTAFDKMSSEEWNVYWRRLVDAVQQHIMPGVSDSTIENELNNLCGLSNWSAA